MSNSVPDGWKFERIENLTLCLIRDFGSFSTTKLIEFLDKGVPFIKSESVKQGTIDLNNVSFISEEVHQLLDKSYVNPGDILFTKIGAIGRAALYGGELGICNSNAATAKITINKKKADSQYITYQLVSERVTREFEKSIISTPPRINLGEINSMKIELPPLPEQKKIAAILTSVDTVIEKTQAQIDKLKDLKTGMMQELLTKGIGHTEFKDSPVGRIPVEWEVVTLADLISSMDGGVSVNSENKQKASGEMGILKTSCVSKGNFYPNENKVVLHNEMDRLKTPVKDDHIIFSRMNTPALVGESGYVNKSYDDLFLPDRLWLIDVYRDKVYVLWLSYILAFNSTRKKITDAATGTSGSMKNISKPSLLSIKIAYPHINEQEKIASILKSVDKKLNKTLHKLSSYQNIKKVLMQDLLTGKVRVKL